MITLNMDRKSQSVKVPISAFTAENNILTLNISVGDYDLIGKTITAVFKGKPETAPLEVVDSIIKLPVKSGMVEKGLNYIQLNFRWGDNKLEQSPLMYWNVSESIMPADVDGEQVDIVTALISQVNKLREQTEQGEIDRNNLYDQAEANRDNLYSQAETNRDNLYSQAETDRSNQFSLQSQEFLNEKSVEIDTAKDNKIGEVSTQFQQKYDGLEQEYASNLTEVKSQLAQIANEVVYKDELLSPLTAKDGVKTWAQLQAMTSGNAIGDYYYCSNGDGINPPGNYRWTGSAWSFGGTGDEGYNKLKSDINKISYFGTSPQLIDPELVLSGRVIPSYHVTPYNATPNTDTSYKTLPPIEFENESVKTLRMNFLPTAIQCYRALDGTYEGVALVSTVVNNGDGSYSVTTTTANKAKYVRLQYGATSYPNLIPFVTLENEWDGSIDPSIYGDYFYLKEELVNSETIVNKSVTIDKLSDDVLDIIGYSENPCDYKGSEINVLYKGICIGDSLTVGIIEHNEGGTVLSYVDDNASYPANLIRLTGLTINKFAQGGKTCKTWYEQFNATNMSGNKFAIIWLGVNDVWLNNGWDSSTNQSSTYLQLIINKLKSENTGIKIFVCTIPTIFKNVTGFDFRAASTGIRQVVSNNTDCCYIIDLEAYSDLTDANLSLYKNGGHLNAIGYYRLAEILVAYISSIIANNRMSFKDVQFIGTSYSYT